MITSTPTALVAAAPTLFRQGLVATLREQWPELQVTLTADATQVAELLACCSFELLLLDGALPGRVLTELLGRLHRTRPTQRLLLLTDVHASRPADGILPWPGNYLQVPRHVPPLTLVAILAPWLDAPCPRLAQAHRAATYSVADAFSTRELEVLRLVVADYCNEEIADKLCLSVRTVESHRRTLIQKAGTRTLVGLAARAVREGWVA